MRTFRLSLFCLFAIASIAEHSRAAIIFSASAPNPAGIQSTVDAFRAELGNLNGNLPRNFTGGRRQIDWDGVPNAFADPNPFPGNFFNGNVPGRARGMEFVPTGTTTSFSVSASAASGTPPRFNTPGGFTAFSEERLFTPLGGTTFDVVFFDPANQTTPALSRGFGSVFTDVETAGFASMSFYGADGNLLEINGSPATLFVAAGVNAGLSFLGVTFDIPTIARISINAGIGGSDSIVMDDFIFGEPTSAAVPEPSSLAVFALGIGLYGVVVNRRRR